MKYIDTCEAFPGNVGDQREAPYGQVVSSGNFLPTLGRMAGLGCTFDSHDNAPPGEAYELPEVSESPFQDGTVIDYCVNHEGLPVWRLAVNNNGRSIVLREIQRGSLGNAKPDPVTGWETLFTSTAGRMMSKYPATRAIFGFIVEDKKNSGSYSPNTANHVRVSDGATTRSASCKHTARTISRP